jgi:drug/metabolite transporter (DMT)-like permease
MASPVQRTIAPGRAEVPTRPGISRTDALLLFTALVWGVNYTVVKYGTTRLDPLAYNGARILIAIAIFGVMAVRRPGRRPIARTDVLALLALGLLGHGVYQYLFAEGVAHTRAGSAALVLAATPAFTAIIGRVMGVERIRRRGAAGIVLSAAGIAIIVYGGARHQSGSPTLQGNLLILGGAVSSSV